MRDFPWMGVIFWVGIFTWFSVVAWTRFLRERERQQTLRTFATSGQPLDPETMEKLFPKHLLKAQMHGSDSSTPESTARGLVIGGMVVLFAGIGLLIGAQLIGRIERDALFGMSAGGVIAACVGLGMIAASIVLRRSIEHDRARLAAEADPR